MAGGRKVTDWLVDSFQLDLFGWFLIQDRPAFNAFREENPDRPQRPIWKRRKELSGKGKEEARDESPDRGILRPFKIDRIPNFDDPFDSEHIVAHLFISYN